MSVLVRGAVPSWPPAAHTGLEAFPAFLGELLGCLSVLQDPVVLGFEPCPVGQQVPRGSRVCQLLRAGLGFLQVPQLLLVLGPTALVPSPWSAGMERVWKQHSK